MEIPVNFSTFAQWSAILTLVCFALAVLGFILQWRIRFRLVGATGFMIVLTVGLFALGLALFPRTVVPGAVRFSRVYDNGANQTVITVPPQITESEAEATLRQAASDLYSPGRLGLGNSTLTIRLRTVLHPETGLSKPLYLGQVQRSLTKREDENMKLELFSENIAQLPPMSEKK